MTRARIFVAALGVLATLGSLGFGCSKRHPEYTGIGQWRFGHTTLKDVTEGLCQPSELADGRAGTWCFAQAPYKIGTSSAEVHLYLDGTEPKAKLIEIQLSVRGCHEDQVESWMRSSFGAPIESKSTRGYWKNSVLWAAAFMPSEPGRCLLRFVPLSENAAIERIKLTGQPGQPAQPAVPGQPAKPS